MYKSLLILILILFISESNNLAQQNGAISKLNTSRLFVDFEVKDIQHPDTLLLNSINLDNYEASRKENTRVDVLDANTGFTLILYSQTEATTNRAAKWPLQKVNLSEKNHTKAK